MTNIPFQTDTPELAEALSVAIRSIQFSHQILIDFVKTIFSDSSLELTPSQVLLVANIGHGGVSREELKKTGSNFAYNVRKLIDLGYVQNQKATNRHGKRIVLTEKGLSIRTTVVASYERQMLALTTLGGLSVVELRTMNAALNKLSEFWAHQLTYRL